MIIYDLVCVSEHRFEGWFKNASDLDDQLETGLLVCPVCGTEEIRKIPSTNGIQARSEDKEAEAANVLPVSSELTCEIINRLHDYVDKHYEDVGTDFSEEAKKMLEDFEEFKDYEFHE